MSNTTNTDFSFDNFDLTTLLPGLLQDNPFYTDYLDASTQVYKDAVLPYIKSLAELRQTIDYDSKDNQELWTLIRNANLIGYKFLSSYMTQDNYVKLVEFISRFYEIQGTKQLANFIGFIRGATIQIDQLWTALGDTDYIIFKEKAAIDGNTVVEHPGQSTDGTFYPTSHYRMKYGLDESGALDNSVLTELFYNLAPIHFVLESIVASLDFANEPFYMDVQSSIYITEPVLVDKALLSLTYSSGIPLTFNSGTSLEYLSDV